MGRAIATEARKGIPAAVTGSVAAMPVPPIRRGLNINSSINHFFRKLALLQTLDVTNELRNFVVEKS